jgi:hypothetical protein
MKSIQQTYFVRAATTAILAMIFTIGCYAQESAGGGRLVGTWDAVVTIRDCATGNALNTFASIASINQGGTSIGSTAGLPQASRTPEHGVWRHVKGNTYAFKFKSFNFSPAGVAVSYVIVEHEVELEASGNSYVSAGTAKFFLLNGTQVGQGCSDAIGTRFEL